MIQHICFNEVQEIEKQIWAWTEQNEFSASSDEIKRVQGLFSRRRELLNKCCLPTEENVLALKNTIGELNSIILATRHRILQLVDFVFAQKIDEESPSWNINANVSVHDTRGYGTELSDDRAYGSDFTIMRIALNRVIKCEIWGETFIPLVEVSIDREYLEKDRCLEHWMESEEYQDWYRKCVAGCDWAGEYFRGIPFIPGLNKAYWSVPDVLRFSNALYSVTVLNESCANE